MQAASESDDAGAEEANAVENKDTEPQEDQASQAGAADEKNFQDDSDWDNRVLCSDGNCIGVIGPDGNCKECGKPYDPDADE
jgi:hypothetical protein